MREKFSNSEHFCNHLMIGTVGKVGEFFTFNEFGRVKITIDPPLEFKVGEEISARSIAFKAFYLRDIKLSRWDCLKKFIFGDNK